MLSAVCIQASQSAKWPSTSKYGMDIWAVHPGHLKGLSVNSSIVQYCITPMRPSALQTVAKLVYL